MQDYLSGNYQKLLHMDKEEEDEMIISGTGNIPTLGLRQTSSNENLLMDESSLLNRTPSCLKESDSMKSL